MPEGAGDQLRCDMSTSHRSTDRSTCDREYDFAPAFCALTRELWIAFSNFFGFQSGSMVFGPAQLVGKNWPQHFPVGSGKFRLNDARLPAMNIEEWWPHLTPATREVLIENNGDNVPPEIVAEIAKAGGSISQDFWWIGQIGPSGVNVSDEAADWIETVANDEVPDPG